MKLNRIFASLFAGILVFAFALLVSFTAYFYFHRNDPILYRSEATQADKYYVDVFIQNPFRDKTKENIVDSFLDSVKGREISEAFIGRKNLLNSYQGCGSGKLTKWELWNRFDNENETEFYYGVYQELSPNVEHLGWVSILLVKEHSKWKVKGYVCRGTSIGS